MENKSHKTFEEQIKDYLKENLVIEITLNGCNHNQLEVGLRFVGEKNSFIRDCITI